MRRSDLDYLHALRLRELETWLARLPAGKNLSLLEIGAGTGAQAAALTAHFGTVTAVDMAGTSYATARVFPVQDYDGRRLPFADASFDIVYSSHLLEHVPDLVALSGEIRRVLRPGGMAIHVVPTPAWRIWTSVTHYLSLPSVVLSRAGGRTDGATPGAGKSLAANILSLLFAPAHGARAGRLTEAWYFRSAWWRRQFHRTGWRVTDEFPLRLFYTGNIIFGSRLSLAARQRLAQLLGSASRCFVLRNR